METSRLRWQRDLDQGREALTFDGEAAEAAEVPEPLSDAQRLGVSFLLEEDRARAMTLRWPLLDLRAVLARHMVAGGTAAEAGRLDYLVAWAQAPGPLDHREVSDEIADSLATPGARLSNGRSNQLHRARRSDPVRYRALVTEELSFKADVVDRASAVLAMLPTSRLQLVYRALESDAQRVWRDRLRLHASDLVRFGRTSWLWRNRQVEMLDKDKLCAAKLAAVGNPQVAQDMARNAGVREIALATVTALNPLRITVASRRLGDGATVVALHINGLPCIEASAAPKLQAGSFKFAELSLGELTADGQTDQDGSLLWSCRRAPAVLVGDELVVADTAWFGKRLASGHEINIERPGQDKTSAPGPNCLPGAYDLDPDGHQWCCRSHEAAEAAWADELAARRDRGELNPEVWPPVVDDDQFDTTAAGTPTDLTVGQPDGATAPADLTIDDLD